MNVENNSFENTLLQMAPSVMTEALALPEILVLPVSGQSFVYQMGMLQALAAAGYRPQTTLGASGGALVGCQAIANDYNVKQWRAQIAGTTDVEVLRKPIFGYLQSCFESAIYTRGSGLDGYYRQLVGTPEALKRYRQHEVVINAYNTSTGQTDLFSTTTAEKSIFYQRQNGRLPLLGISQNIHYLGGLSDPEYRERLYEVLVATSSVPIVFDRMPIGDEYYADGGVCFSSPLTAVSCVSSLREVLYLSPNDMDVPFPVTYGAVIDNAIAYACQVSRSNSLQDRFTFLQSLCCGDFDALRVAQGVFTGSEFRRDLAKTSGARRLVELYPLQSDTKTMVDLVSRDERLTAIRQASQNFGYRIFYIQ